MAKTYSYFAPQSFPGGAPDTPDLIFLSDPSDDLSIPILTRQNSDAGNDPWYKQESEISIDETKYKKWMMEDTDKLPPDVPEPGWHRMDTSMFPADDAASPSEPDEPRN